MSAGFEMPATIRLKKLDVEIVERDLPCASKRVGYIRVDIAQAQLDKMRVARGLQHDAKWHDLYRAINAMVTKIVCFNDIAIYGGDFEELLEALIEIDNGVYIEPEKWSVL